MSKKRINVLCDEVEVEVYTSIVELASLKEVERDEKEYVNRYSRQLLLPSFGVKRYKKKVKKNVNPI